MTKYIWWQKLYDIKKFLPLLHFTSFPTTPNEPPSPARDVWIMHFGPARVVPQRPARNGWVRREDGWQGTRGGNAPGWIEIASRAAAEEVQGEPCNRCSRFSRGRSVCYSLNRKLFFPFVIFLQQESPYISIFSKEKSRYRICLACRPKNKRS